MKHKPIPMIGAKAKKRFWAKVNKQGKNKCWNWLASCTSNKNYGCFGLPHHGTFYAHRVAWKLATGQDPKKLKVLHHCDNGKCVNPSHLFLGTQADNIRDMVKKGRQKGDYRPGEKCPTAKLKETDIIAIRKKRKNHMVIALAKEYNVSDSTISMICNRHIWKHI